MFGIDFDGHPNLTHLYLPDQFLGNPLRKSYPLLSREVKPWPGTVDVEAMPGRDEGTEEEEAEGDEAESDGPSEENPEA
jgi:NADH-quinone oxidoreductase subunit C